MKKSKGLVTVRCECGHEILLLPDLKAMGKAIDDHVDFHLNNMKKRNCTAAEAERLRKALIAQAFRLASKDEAENNK